jgi:hypothetical protein
MFSATREEEVDRLLRGEVFIDLHSITKQSVRAGIEQYSLCSAETVKSRPWIDQLADNQEGVDLSAEDFAVYRIEEKNYLEILLRKPAHRATARLDVTLLLSPLAAPFIMKRRTDAPYV